MPSQPSNHKAIAIRGAFALAVLLLLALWLYKCQSPVPAPIPPSFKPDIIRRDSFIQVVKYRDSIRVKYVTKWRSIRHDSLIPCETIVQFCDTVILNDSLTIAAQADVIRQDSVIIGKAMERITSDSVTIGTLNRKLKWQKIFTKGAFFGGAALGAAASAKLSN